MHSVAGVSCRTLGALAEKCHAFAKALHYREIEFTTHPENAVEALISINNHLRLPEAADGILAYAQQTLHMELKVGWPVDAARPTLPIALLLCVPSPSSRLPAKLTNASLASHIDRQGSRECRLLMNSYRLQSVRPAIPQHIDGFMQESWYEKLNRWDEALEAYERKYTASRPGTPAHIEASLGRCRWVSLAVHVHMDMPMNTCVQ